ncbi:DEAD/DEAH box helicase [Williamsia muralis]|nr:DEAD/DEAH box helicase [Williamsia marianensis]
MLISTAQQVHATRQEVGTAGSEAEAGLRRRVIDLHLDEDGGVRVLPLRHGDLKLLAAIAQRAALAELNADAQNMVTSLTTDVARAVNDARSFVGARRLLMRKGAREAGRHAGVFLENYMRWAHAENVPYRLSELLGAAAATVDIKDMDTALGQWLASAPETFAWGTATVVDGAPAKHLARALTTIERAVASEAEAKATALQAGTAVRRTDTDKLVHAMPVGRLKDATRDRLRVSALTDAGIDTVGQVLKNQAILESLPGVGPATATRIRGAAQTLWQTTYDEMPVRIDINDRSPRATNLLRALGRWRALRAAQPPARELALLKPMAKLAAAASEAPARLAIFAPHTTHTPPELVRDLEAIQSRARTIAAADAPITDLWDQFLAYPADYYALLSELGLLTEDENRIFGDLPDDIVAAVRQQELNTEHLNASLRGYQSFGARFALAQKKVIIGDEMGLGKTIEAIAVIAHLRAKGSHHSLVVCPAAVVTNWIREISTKSTIRPHRLHGPARHNALRSWSRTGGVAVTTFETLPWLSTQQSSPADLGCVIIDEAHYIKNPQAQRSQRAVQLMNGSARTILLTGTPLENRLDEFKNLVQYVRPDLTVDATELSPRRFRQQVAPAYLRRNQEDVLTELPELVEVQEWVPMSPDDLTAYRNAVHDGNFMAMRQAAMTQGKQSQKLTRLIDLVAEAEANERRVIVFSHFRSVLDEVVRALPGEVVGPLTGSVPAARRQEMVDQFTAAGHGAVLVSQIVAGGVGLNIQAASVVIICEPQLKPTTEWQAIARARRMGQLESVQVHRLLTEEGVDLRITELLVRKRELFNDFARISDIAESAPEAVDISEAELAREVIADERQRLFAEEQL